MDQIRYVSTAAVAEALGVSVTTVKRWVDEDVLPAHKTVGGHRKILVRDVLHLVRQENLPHVDLSRLTGSLRALPKDVTQIREDLYTALQQGDSETARTLIHNVRQIGIPLDELADFVIAPAMKQIGHGWEEGQLDVYQEHRGTQLCLTALLSLKGQLSGSGEGKRPLAVGGGAEHDHYLLANVLAEMVLLEQGWNAINLGPNTPLLSFRNALRELRPRLLWVSCSYLPDPEGFLREYRQLYHEAEEAGVAVAVGGQALSDGIRARMPYTTHGDGLTHLAAFARSLHPPPRQRRERKA
jgi:excisionase family DNA binding protein